MTRRVKQTSKTLPRVRSTSRRLERVDPGLVAEKLGAQRTGARTSIRGGPAALFALRQELARRLVSTGGRPRLEGTERRQKIPLADEDWVALGKLAKYVSDEELHPTPGQIASVLLHQALEQTIDEVELKASFRRRSRTAGKKA